MLSRKSLMLSLRRVVCHERTNIADTDGDDDLKAYLDEKVSCVDFEISQGEPGLTLELNCGASVWKPVNVMKPRSENIDSEKSVLSVEELVDLDEIEFEDHAVTGALGVVLRKGSWIPIATRTCSRLKHPNIPFSYSK